MSTTAQFFENRTVQVIGAAGFIGSQLSYRLDNYGTDLQLIDIWFRDDLKQLTGLNERTYQEKVLDHISYQARIPNVFVNLACTDRKESSKNPQMAFLNNVGDISGYLRQAFDIWQHHKNTTWKHPDIPNPIERYIHFSTASVFGNPTCLPIKESNEKEPVDEYGFTKGFAEGFFEYAKKMNFPFTILRPFNIYGPGGRVDRSYPNVISIFLYNLVKGNPITVYGNGEQTKDFTFIDDMLDVVELASMKPAAIAEDFNICTGREVSINELIEIMQSVTGKDFVEIKIASNKSDKFQRRFGDNTKAQELLNWKPKVSLEEGLLKTYQWIEETYAESS